MPTLTVAAVGRHNAVPVVRGPIIGRTYDEGLSPWPGRMFVLGLVVVAIAAVVGSALILGRLLSPDAVWMP